MKPESLLGIALEAIAELAAPGPYPADARMGRLFRKKRFLGSHDRAFVGVAAYAWLRHFHRARPRWTAWLSARRDGRLPELLSSKEQGFLADVLTLARDGLFPWDFERAFDVVKRKHPDLFPGDWVQEGGWPEDELDRLAAELSLPAWLAQSLRAERGEEEARRLAAALLEPAQVDLRVNLRRVGREAAGVRLAEELGCEVQAAPWSPLGLRMAARKNLGATQAFRSGWFEVADEGSQLVVLALEPRPQMTVVDACAGAGGKTLAIADILFRGDQGESAVERSARHEGGSIVACDVAPQRLEELRRRARACGLEESIAVVLLQPGATEPPEVPPADLVLVDAPCSGLGTLRRNPDLKHRYGPEDIDSFAGAQRSILERFAPVVKPGGTLAYATCSILRRENEDVAGAFSAGHPEFEESLLPWARAHLSAACLSGNHVRIDPLRTGTDGFFLATWRRK